MACRRLAPNGSLRTNLNENQLKLILVHENVCKNVVWKWPSCHAINIGHKTEKISLVRKSAGFNKYFSMEFIHINHVPRYIIHIKTPPPLDQQICSMIYS